MPLFVSFAVKAFDIVVVAILLTALT